MDARRLQIFRAVALAGSISAGARALGWTQPAVSQHLRALEREVGAALLLRGSSGVELTEPGRVLLARAHAIAGELRMADEEISAITRLRRGRVRLGAYPTAAATWAPAAVARLLAAHPDIDVTLIQVPPPDAVGMLVRGDADLALVFRYEDSPEEVDGPDVDGAPVGDDPIDLVLPDGHPAAARGTPRLADLGDADWIAGCELCRGHLTRRCRAAGFTPRIRHVSDDYVVVQNLVAAGLGVALLPRSSTAAHRNPDVVLHPSAQWGRRTLGVIHRAGAERVPATAAMLAQIRATVPV